LLGRAGVPVAGLFVHVAGFTEPRSPPPDAIPRIYTGNRLHPIQKPVAIAQNELKVGRAPVLHHEVKTVNKPRI
jgi:hypothetical protein